MAWLTDHYWKHIAAAAGSRATLARETVTALAAHSWPGNVRELQNVLANLRPAFLLAEEEVADVDVAMPLRLPGVVDGRDQAVAESYRYHCTRPPVGFAAGEDGFEVPQIGHGAEEGAAFVVEECGDALHGERSPGEVGVDQLFGHRGRNRAAGRPLTRSAWRRGLLAPPARRGQCTAVAVGQYSTLRWCISASSSKSWWGTFGS